MFKPRLSFPGMRWSGLLAASVVAVNVCTTLPISSAHASALAEPSALAAAIGDEQKAVEQAEQSGVPVEVVSLREEDSLVYANPDGTFTQEMTASPQRVQRADGSWVAVDPTLERRPDGSIGPKAAAVDLSFSKGGESALVELNEDGKALSLSWPSKLPEPTLSGDTATYAEVLPGVDLKMSASPTGYAYVLVVKDAAAADNADLERLQLSAEAKGVSLRTAPAGGLEAVDATGATVFAGGTPTMWDSSGEAAVDAGAPASGPASGEDVKPVDPSAGASSGDRTADVSLDVTASSVTLVPDAGLLHSEDTVFPLYIDPDATVSRTDWMYVSSGWPSTEYYKFDDDKGVGRCTVEGGIVCSTDPYTNRMYFKFTPNETTWANRSVKKAVFRVYETWSFTCSASWVKVNLVDAAKVNSSTNWNNKPANGDQMGDRKVAYGRGSACDPDAPASWVEFKDNADETDENLTPTVRKKLKDGDPIAFALSASDESDGNSWKRFRGDNAALSVTYNTKPATPTGPDTTSPVTSCVTGASRPYINDNSPMLHVNAYDAENQNLTATFEVTDVNTGVSKDYVTASKADSSDFSAQLKDLVHGHVYRWRAMTNDGMDDSVGWSQNCEFAIDTQRPSPPVVSSTVFPADEWSQLKAGQSGRFTFTASSTGDTVYGNDTNFYEWAIANDNPTNAVNPATLGAVGEKDIVPSTFGPNVLYARAVDRAGNRSTAIPYVFKPLRPCDDLVALTCAAGAYQFDDNTGTVAADASGKGHPVTLAGPVWTAGRKTADVPSDRAIKLDGVDDVGTAAPVVDTRQAFTVSAWVKLNGVAANAAVVSQSGTNGAGLSLAYWKPTGKWVFMRHRADIASPTAAQLAQAFSVNAPEVGKWTHLAGTYDPNSGDMTLYVDGRAQETVKYSEQPWNAADALRVGHTKWNGNPADRLPGEIDDVRIFSGLLDSADIYQLARG
jgi:Concanavalin A-like lectin/glucanases superfamily